MIVRVRASRGNEKREASALSRRNPREMREDARCWSDRLALTDVPDSCYRRDGFFNDSRRASMATRAKKSRGKSKSASSRSGSKRSKSTKSRGKSAAAAGASSSRSASSTRSTASAKSGRSASTKRSAATGSTRKAGTRKAATGSRSSSAKSTSARQSSSRIPAPIARVTRVAQEVAKEAGSAVVAGVEAIKDLGSSVVDRVTG